MRCEVLAQQVPDGVGVAAAGDEQLRAGVLVRRGDARDLARALSDLLADPGRRARLAETGRRVAAQYDWSVVARRVLAVYETVILPGSGEVTASDDDDRLADLATLPGNAPSRSALRRWVQR